MTPPVPSGNIAERLSEMARQVPDQTAVIVAHRRRPYQSISFRALDELSTNLARGLLAWGVPENSRIVLMVRPGIEFIALTFALFRAGCIVVLIDPGMGRSRIFDCLKQINPDGFIAIPIVQAIRWWFRKQFPKSRHLVTVGGPALFGGIRYEQLLAKGIQSQESVPVGQKNTQLPSRHASSEAAIIFTSGSTGPPKGVLYEHGMFDAQVRLLRDYYQIKPGEIDLSGFPLFALFNSALGVTTVIPEMNPTRPAQVDPENILGPITKLKITQAFGSPAIWNRVGRYCQEQKRPIPFLRRILSAGAPVPIHVIEKIQASFADPNTALHTPYGATEALPITSISSREILSETAARSRVGQGTCVGRPFPEVEVRILEITEGPIPAWDPSKVLPTGEIGEIVVSGPSVTRSYFEDPRATSLAKIPDGERFWHRMGDVGYLDAHGRLWFCGRKAHVVWASQGPMWSIPTEAIFNEHPHVFRSALVSIKFPSKGTLNKPPSKGTNNTIPGIVVEPLKGAFPRSSKDEARFMEDLKELGKQYPHTASIEHFLFHRSFPVDIRHNVKINREALSLWASEKLSRQRR